MVASSPDSVSGMHIVHMYVHVDRLVRILLNGSNLMMEKYQRPSWMMKRYVPILNRDHH